MLQAKVQEAMWLRSAQTQSIRYLKHIQRDHLAFCSFSSAPKLNKIITDVPSGNAVCKKEIVFVEAAA